MQEFKRSVLVLLFVCLIFVTLFYLCGGSLDGILYATGRPSMHPDQLAGFGDLPLSGLRRGTTKNLNASLRMPGKGDHVSVR
jgi:hypothetical protein